MSLFGFGKVKRVGPRKLHIEVSIPEGVSVETSSAWISAYFGDPDAEVRDLKKGRRDDMIRTMAPDDTLEIRVPEDADEQLRKARERQQ